MEGDALSVDADEPPAPKFAFIGVRSCELRAIAIQDRVFLSGPYKDLAYARRREHCYIVAVNCGQAGGTCFCVSMQAGPKAEGGYDLALTELLDETRHDFLVETGSEKGAALLQCLPHRAPSDVDFAAAEAAICHARNGMGRVLQTKNLKQVLQSSRSHPRWDEIAARCLASYQQVYWVLPLISSDAGELTVEKAQALSNSSPNDFRFEYAGRQVAWAVSLSSVT